MTRKKVTPSAKVRVNGTGAPAKTKTTKRKLIQLVNARLAKVGHGIVFDVIEDGVRQEESWWHVPVVATRHGKDVPWEITINVFANVEDELEQEHNLSALFVPAVAEAGIR
jgi:hypothetical protein